jgi:DNA-binding transcriptional LysR family regulator
MIPPLRKLQYVLAVARELHFRRAAEKLHVSQPAVSRQVRQCEEEFGFEILRRDHHFVALTKAGQSFVIDLDAILDRFDNDLRQAINKAQAISRQTASEYVVAHSPYAPPVVRRIALRLQQRIFREFRLRFRILATTEIISAIRHDVIQAGITFAPIQDEDLVVSEIGTDTWAAVVPAIGRFAHLRTARIEEFSGLPIISNGAERTHPTLFRTLEEQCAARGFLFQTIAEVSSPNEAFDLVRENVGVVLLPAGACENPPPGTRVICITDLAPLEMVMAYRPDCSAFIPLFAERIRLSVGHERTHQHGSGKNNLPCTG